MAASPSKSLRVRCIKHAKAVETQARTDGVLRFWTEDPDLRASLGLETTVEHVQSGDGEGQKVGVAAHSASRSEKV